MATTYSEYYKRRMNERFKEEEPKSIVKTEKPAVKTPSVNISHKFPVPEKEREKRDNLGKIVLICLFALILLNLIYFLPSNSTYYLFVIAGISVVLAILILSILHGLYESGIRRINPWLMIAFVYVILGVNMFLGNGYLYSVEWAFLGFVAGAVIFYDSKIDSRFLILPALLLLGYIPFLLIGKQNALAEIIAIYVYYFLVVGVGLQLVENFKDSKDLYDFEHSIKKIMIKTNWNDLMIFFGFIAICVIIANRFYEIEIWKWTSVYFFSVVLVCYIISMMFEDEKKE